jgi:hypothetical protein
MIRLAFFISCVFFATAVWAQVPGRFGGGRPLQNMPGSGLLGGNRIGGGGGSGPFKDSLLHRTGLEDSVTIMFRYLDTARFYYLDSSVNDFTKRWPIGSANLVLGNIGSASRSYLFSPNLKPGWDHGFHAYDAYIPKIEETKFYNTTRPYSQLSYIVGTRAEQTIGVFHTQNIRYNWNFAFNFNLINSPGIFRNQKNAHNNYHFNTWYTTPKRRYSVFFIAASARIGATENGGLKDVNQLGETESFGDRFNILTNFGGNGTVQIGVLSNEIKTGNLYNQSAFILRHHYDFGKKDSVIVNDSTTVYLFYPRLRFQHTASYKRYSFEFKDVSVDTLSYKQFYQFAGAPTVFGIKDFWSILDNELAIYQFPELKNSQQFLKVAAGYQLLNADFGVPQPSYNNLYVNGEYRNKTRNKKWDMGLAGTFYVAGLNGSDYHVSASLKRLIGKKLGYLALGFENVNRSPSFIHNDLSNFKRFTIGNTSFKKENTTVASAQYELPQLQLVIGGKYFLASNYIYFQNYTQAEQEATLFNVLQVHAHKKFKLLKKVNWYTDLYVQQTTANAPVNLPLAYTRNRFAFEGVFFRNLNLSTGLEMRYHTPYKADGFSPLLGQFFLQNTTTINNLPDIAAFVHFRIRSLSMFLRAENLNAVQVSPDFGFFNNNMVTPLQPMPGLQMRFGIFWGFVN